MAKPVADLAEGVLPWLGVMPRWLWFAPLAVLIIGTAAWAFRWGWIVATITETDVINIYAQRYLNDAGTGAQLSDCIALPGQRARVWILVRCTRADARFDYPADRFGRLLELPDGSDAGGQI